MTQDLRPLLERARRLAPPTITDLPAIRSRRDRKRRRERVGAIVLGLSLTAALVVGATSIMGGTRDTDAGTGEGEAATIPPGLEIPPGEFWYREVLVFGLNQCTEDGGACMFSGPDQGPAPFPYVGVSRSRTWWSPDGPARVVVRELEPRFFSEEEARAFEAENGPIEPGREQVDEYGPGDYAEQNRDNDPAHGGMSSDPALLAEQIQARLGPDAPSPVIHPTPEVEGQGRDVPALVRILEALLPGAQPSLQAALFDVASTWQGMRVDERATDPVRRPAVLLSIETEGVLHRWFFDPATNQLLALGDEWGVVVVTRAGIAPMLGEEPQTELVPAVEDVPLPIDDPRG